MLFLEVGRRIEPRGTGMHQRSAERQTTAEAAGRQQVPSALKGRPGFRVRVGNYRIIYTVHDDVLLAVVLTLGHGRAVFER